MSGGANGAVRRGLVLGIETSCDETAAAVVERGRTVLSSVVSSQVDLHARYGGVVPEIAGRAHVELALPVIKDALAGAGHDPRGHALGSEDGLVAIDAVAATIGPGLIGALLVGVSTAKALALAWDVPFVGVNHLEGHLYAAMLEAPEIDRLAREGDPASIHFPRATTAGAFDFSFSGLKTAVVNYVRAHPEVENADVAASFQEAAVEVLVAKSLAAAEEIGARGACLAGGVAANSLLRERFSNAFAKVGLVSYLPSRAMCTDNAAMIAAAGFFQLERSGPTSVAAGAVPDLPLRSSK